MHRFSSAPLLAGIVVLAACGPLSRFDEAQITGNPGDPGDPGGQEAEPPSDAITCANGSCRAAGALSNNLSEGSCDAPDPASPVCGSGVACDSDGDCAAHPGNYCEPAACQFEGCLRGACKLTKIQGEVCTRDAECVSGDCVCLEEGAPCACGPGGGVLWDADP